MANSMGGQVVADAFSLLYQEADFADAETEIDDVVLTAPDVDHEEFDQQFKHEIDALARNLDLANRVAAGLGRHALALTLAAGALNRRGAERYAQTADELLHRMAAGRGFGDLPRMDKAERLTEVEIAIKYSYDELGQGADGAEQQAWFRALGAFAQEADWDIAAAAAMWMLEAATAREFLLWLHEPPEPDNIKMDHLLAKFFFYGMLDKATIVAHLQAALERRLKIRKGAAEIQFDPPAGPCRPIVDDERVMMTWQTMLDYIRADLDTQIEWLEKTIIQVEKK